MKNLRNTMNISAETRLNTALEYLCTNPQRKMKLSLTAVCREAQVSRAHAYRLRDFMDRFEKAELSMKSHSVSRTVGRRSKAERTKDLRVTVDCLANVIQAQRILIDELSK